MEAIRGGDRRRIARLMKKAGLSPACSGISWPSADSELPCGSWSIEVHTCRLPSERPPSFDSTGNADPVGTTCPAGQCDEIRVQPDFSNTRSGYTAIRIRPPGLTFWTAPGLAGPDRTGSASWYRNSCISRNRISSVALAMASRIRCMISCMIVATNARENRATN